MIIWGLLGESIEDAGKYGEGTATATEFAVTLPLENPPDDMFVDGLALGVGTPALLPEGYEIPDDGLIESSDIFDDIIGLTPQNAIIYRPEGEAPAPWLEQFEPGFSCGACVQIDGSFDEYEPAACEQFEIITSPQEALDMCNYS